MRGVRTRFVLGSERTGRCFASFGLVSPWFVILFVDLFVDYELGGSALHQAPSEKAFVRKHEEIERISVGCSCVGRESEFIGEDHAFR